MYVWVERLSEGKNNELIWKISVEFKKISILRSKQPFK